MQRFHLALVIALLMAPVLAAQEQAPLPEPARALTLEVEGGAVLSFRPSGRTKVELLGTGRAPFAGGELEVEGRTGSVEIKVGRGDLRGLPLAPELGRDFLTYVLWAVPPSGEAVNVGELVFREGRNEELRASAPHRTFWLLVTAEPDFAVHQPSSAAVLVSREQSQTRTGNKATPEARPLLYYTNYPDYDSEPAGAQAPGVPEAFRQAQHALELATRTYPLDQPATSQLEQWEDVQLARAVLERARAHFTEAETELRTQGESDAFLLYARTATQMAESARALALGAAGGLKTRRLRAEVETLRQQLSETQAELQRLRDRYSQLEASLDQERGRTREVEGQLLALREQVNLLENSVATSRNETQRLQTQRSHLCEELRRQLATLGQFTEQGNILALSLASDVLFESGRYELRLAARESLGKLAVLRLLLFPDAPVRFEGHTDLVGEEDYNQWLSEQRALAVYQFLLQEQLALTQIPDERAFVEERLRVVGELLEMNYNQARRQRSRRQELLGQLEEAVVGKGMREPLVPDPGPNAQNRRVALLFASAGVEGLSSLCPSPAPPPAQ